MEPRDIDTKSEYDEYMGELAKRFIESRGGMWFNSPDDVYSEFGYYEGELFEQDPQAVLAYSTRDPSDEAEREAGFADTETKRSEILARNVFSEDVFAEIRRLREESRR